MQDIIGLIDYGAGNLHSVHNALRSFGVEPRLVRAPEELAEIDKLILPGVGSFGDCVENLTRQGLWQPLRDWINDDRPFFGICIGYQVLFASSEESPDVAGLGVFPGKVVRFPHIPGLKVPHMGWNNVRFAHADSPLWQGLANDTFFYFVHSFYPEPEDHSMVAGWTDYNGDFACAISKGNVFAVQFHPERSQASGLKLLENFVKL